MMFSQSRQILGVLGGMGPLASLEFLKTIYEYSEFDHEQEAPRVVLYSDPSFPDRTEAFLSGRDSELLQQMTEALKGLFHLGASNVVLCCVTIHHLLPRLRVDYRRRVISLIDVIYDTIEQGEQKHLMVCSNGTRKLGLFEKHDKWRLLQDRIVMPEESDQMEIHRDLIYPIKRNPDLNASLERLGKYRDKYGLESFIAGCSEMHLLNKQCLSSDTGYRFIDPLAQIAKDLAQGRL